MLGLLAGTGAGLAAVVSAGYHTMAPTSQLYGRTFVRAKDASRQIALTYDDGPNDPWTLRLLDVLSRHQVRATFFLIGRFVEQRPDIARELASAGHLIGNHTYSHPNLIFCSRTEVERQIVECDRALRDAIGDHSNLFRPPFGGRRPQVLKSVRRAGLEPIMWSVTGWDWNATSTEQIEKKVGSHVASGDVVLLHDGGHTHMGADRSFTVEATDRLISRFKQEGYRFVTIPEMMGLTAAVPNASQTGSSL
jgi:peptidoglycan/xylan/chitin deacetylase (PgdA/CDA1 family)